MRTLAVGKDSLNPIDRVKREVFGIIGTVQLKDKTLGIIAIALSVICTEVGMWLGYLVWTW